MVVNWSKGIKRNTPTHLKHGYHVKVHRISIYIPVSYAVSGWSKLLDNSTQLSFVIERNHVFSCQQHPPIWTLCPCTTRAYWVSAILALVADQIMSAKMAYIGFTRSWISWGGTFSVVTMITMTPMTLKDWQLKSINTLIIVYIILFWIKSHKRMFSGCVKCVLSIISIDKEFIHICISLVIWDRLKVLIFVYTWSWLKDNCETKWSGKFQKLEKVPVRLFGQGKNTSQWALILHLLKLMTLILTMGSLFIGIVKEWGKEGSQRWHTSILHIWEQEEKIGQAWPTRNHQIFPGCVLHIVLQFNTVSDIQVDLFPSLGYPGSIRSGLTIAVQRATLLEQETPNASIWSSRPKQTSTRTCRTCFTWWWVAPLPSKPQYCCSLCYLWV